MDNKIMKFSRSQLGGKLLTTNKKSFETSYEYHWHDYYEMILYLNCNGECIVNDRTYKISGNCLFLVTPKDFHEIRTEDNKNSESINISFSEQIVDRHLLSRILTCPIKVPDVDDDIINSINKLYGLFFSDAPYKEKYIEHLFNCILIDIYEKGEELSVNNTFLNPLIQRAISKVITTPGERHTVKSMAHTLGVNADYFSHLFRCETGISFTAYLNNSRIDYAKRLLENSDMSALEISFETGFNTPAHFYKTFKKFTGISPIQYRKNSRSV